MASVTKKSRSKYWFACFRDLQGKQRRLSTKQTDRKKAMKIAEQYEQISQRKLPVHTVRQTLTALAREAYGETFPSATVRQFIAPLPSAPVARSHWRRWTSPIPAN
jgi:hypothetical protein